MEPRTLLDTDILSALMRNDAGVVQRVLAYSADHSNLTISLITRFEVLRGLKVKKAAAKVAKFDMFCQANEVLPISEGVIIRASEIYADLYARGQLIPDADILIAATALESQLVLATNNQAHFARIPALQIDNWLD